MSFCLFYSQSKMNQDIPVELYDGFFLKESERIVKYIEEKQQGIEEEYVFYILKRCIRELFREEDLTYFVEPVLKALADQDFEIEFSYFIHCFDVMQSDMINDMRTSRKAKPIRILPCIRECDANLITTIGHLIRMGMVIVPSVNEQPPENIPSLHQCIMSYWDLGIVKAFIANGMNPNWIDINGRTTMMFAARNVFHAVEIMEYLHKEHNVSYTSNDILHRTTIHYAGSVAALMHINKYIPASKRDGHGFTVMHHICRSTILIDDFIEMLSVLICNKLNINDQNNVKKQTPMMMYFMARDLWRFRTDHIQGIVSMARLFADIEAKDCNGKNAIWYANYVDARRQAMMPEIIHPNAETFLFSRLLQIQIPNIQSSYVMNLLRKNTQITCMLSHQIEYLPFDIILKISQMALPKMISSNIPMVQRAITAYFRVANEKYTIKNRE